jgi:hypothetical protein
VGKHFLPTNARSRNGLDNLYLKLDRERAEREQQREVRMLELCGGKRKKIKNTHLFCFSATLY